MLCSKMAWPTLAEPREQPSAEVHRGGEQKLSTDPGSRAQLTFDREAFMSMIKRALAVTGLAAAFGLSGLVAPALAQQEEPDDQFLALATSSVGGTWYPLGSAMANVITRHYPQLNITTEVTGGTNDNLNLMKNEQVDLALSTSDQAYLATQGEGAFTEGPITNFKGLVSGHVIIWQLYTLKNTGISSIEDLRGKRISLGAAGSIGNEIGEIVLDAHGLVMGQDWQPEYLGHSDGTGALKDGRVDAVLNITSAPAGAITEITSTDGSDVVFVNPDPDVLDELLQRYPYWSEATIPADAYQGQDEDIPGSFGVATILIAADSVDDATAYAITKALLENQAELEAAHALGAEWRPETATRGIEGVIPFHPGAERYLKEQGLL
jgi:uncharacterized protein